MDIIKYLERVTIIYNPDGTVRGSEAHEHTGYFEERPVADAAGGTQQVFVVVKPEVREVAAGDLAGALDDGCPAIEDAAAKAEQIRTLLRDIEAGKDSIAKLSALVDRHEVTIESQAAAIASGRADLGEAGKRETQLRHAVQRLTAENSALAAELEALRDAATQESPAE